MSPALPPLPSFAAFFTAVHGHAPYPWQAALAEHVCTTGTWPAAIGAPTGAGKTATLDVALYAQAAEAHLPPERRRAPRRTVLVVDRRTVVDQAFTRARRLRDALVTAADSPTADPALTALAARLRALMGAPSTDEEPLQIALLRGGIPRDDGWARRPDQALLAVSTVDQVGSRLLFRGYGVRPRLHSLHAGLLGHDTLFLLDEVHLARPFEETLLALQTRWRRWAEAPLPDRWQCVRLSATQGPEVEPFGLTAADRDHPRLARRLHAGKRLQVEDVATRTHGRDGPAKAWLTALTKAAEAQLKAGARCLGLIVNRVDTAAALATRLTAPDREVLLITGRMRPADRAAIARRLTERAGPGWPAVTPTPTVPFICVSTQCLEAGADLDFDGLITELASLDALVQRLGRLNRTGDHPAATATLLAPKLDDTDPVYGPTLAPTLAWLLSEGAAEGLDASPAHLEHRLAAAPAEAAAPRRAAALLLPAHLDLLAQTGPAPHPDPDVAAYLHGLSPPRPDVNLIWRADAPLSDPERATARLLVVPPTAFEALSLPIGTARRWLAGLAPGSLADVAAEIPAEAPRRRPDLVALSWDGDRATPATLQDLRPGGTYILPVERGGIHAGTFDGISDVPVSDQGDLGRTLASGRPTLRLDLALYGVPDPSGSLRWPPGLTAPPALPDRINRLPREAQAELRDWLRTLNLSGPPLPEPLASLLPLLQRSRQLILTEAAGAWVLQGEPLATPALLALAQGDASPPADAGTTAGDSATASRRLELNAHLADVGRWAAALATAIGLPPALVADLELAGRAHDLGKADPRFKIALYGGDPAAVGRPALAKSGADLQDRLARRRAAERAGLPAGFRHELSSVALLTHGDGGRTLLAGAHDPDLVLHLIASHHGFARPLAPVDHPRASGPFPVTELRHIFDGHTLTAPIDHGLEALDSGISARFWLLQRRYGWWGLAWLEAILRLADHRASEAHERAPESPKAPESQP